jgi:hypothetical protein
MEGESRMARQSSKEASPTASSLATRMKTPALAGGAAMLGFAGGVALGRRSAPSTSANLAETAKQIGNFGEKVGHLATQLNMVREGVAQEGKRSPIEIVLEGLTSRRI